MQLAKPYLIPNRLRELAETMIKQRTPKGSDSHIKRDFTTEDMRQLGIEFFASMLKVLSNNGNWEILKKIKDYKKVSPKETYNLHFNLNRLQDLGLVISSEEGSYALTKLGEKLLSSSLSLSFYLQRASRGEQNIVLLQLLISKEEKSFTKLNKDLRLNVGSLYRSLDRLVKLGFVSKSKDKQYIINNKASLEPLREFCEDTIKKFQNMGLYFQDGIVRAHSLPERLTSLPVTYGLEYIPLQDVINDHVVVTYSYESKEKKREEIARRIIYEQSRWKGNLCKPILPEQVGRIQIAYDVSQLASLHQLINLFCLHAIKSFDRLMVEQIAIPNNFLDKLDSKPRYGISGIRELLKVSDRPILHVVIPSYLKNHKDTTKFIQQLFEAGVDAVGDHQFIGLGLEEFRKRIEEVVEVIEVSSKQLPNKLIFYPYIEGANFMEKIEIIKNTKCKFLGLGLSPLSIGIPTTIFLRRNYHFPLHLHLTLHGIYTRMGQNYPYYSREEGFKSGHGINLNVILKLLALCGGDEINVDYSGYYSIDPKEVEIHCRILQRFNVFPALVGGINLDNLRQLILNYGKDVIIKIGGGRFLERENQIIEFVEAYKQLIENTAEGKLEESENIKYWKVEEGKLRKKDQDFLMGFIKEI